jgi:O-succinylbenzoic acid--CoA ligase
VSEPQPLSLVHHARTRGDDVALVVDGESHTYRDLSPLVRESAAQMVPGPHPLAVVAEPTLQALLFVYACLDLKKPMALVHPRAPQSWRDAFVLSTGADALFDGALQRLIPRIALAPRSEPAQALIQTSGSTGEPKTVALTQKSLLFAARAANTHLPLDSSCRWALTLPFSHVGGLSILLRCLIAGAAPTVTGQLLSDETARQYERLGITHVSLVPTQRRRSARSGRPAGPRAKGRIPRTRYLRIVGDGVANQHAVHRASR